MGVPHTHAFERAYDDYSDGIFRHLFYRLGNRDRALELMQEVFTRFWTYLDTGHTVEYPKAFLYRSAHNALVNEFRKPGKTVSLDALAEKGFDVAYTEADQEERARQQEVVDRLALLDDKYRDVLTLRYVDGLAVKEIAELLNERENTISVRIRRGLEKIKNTYEHP